VNGVNTSQMHLKYASYFRNESSESLLEVYGIVTKDSQQKDALRPKQCPNCNESNKPDSNFCAKCRMIQLVTHIVKQLKKRVKKKKNCNQ